MDQHTHSHHAHDFDWDAMVGHAELDAEVLRPFLDEAIDELAGFADRDGLEVRRILDVGSGPGVATCALAERFAGASVVAADGSTEMLANVAARAERLGLAGRVETQLIELPDGLDDLGPADLVWASMVLHHVGDEAATLRALRSHLETGGLLALVEFGDPLRVVPGDAELWSRLDAAGAAWMKGMRAELPGATVSADYPTMLAAAGLVVVVDRTVTVRLDPPLDDRARRVAHGYLERMRQHQEPYADAADLAVLDALIDQDGPDGILQRPDALLHVSRHLFVARAADR
jgi:SAM-dependent methyltransferase